MDKLDEKQRKFSRIVIFYPLGVFVVSLLINWVFLDVRPLTASTPDNSINGSLAVSGVIMLINHVWLMTSTELVRVRYRIYATPEEWKASDSSIEDVSDVGWQELERVQNAHRNTNENTVYFLALVLPFALSSPPSVTAYLWIVSYALARLGYTYSYLSGRDNLRGLFITLGLLSLFGIASYFLMALLR
ncbi:MAPEG family protein [Vibrio penaeicida]|uniref:MAPEG family protein n=1 Tax=Vibrio penaeicida TaxID=104609 RepID=UPI00273642B4|nr:MAPEG family protein [Vibrio penaeicida]MDP2575889.1 MAPEG family protein [Vibrio penaeicida]